MTVLPCPQNHTWSCAGPLLCKGQAREFSSLVAQQRPVATSQGTVLWVVSSHGLG